MGANQIRVSGCKTRQEGDSQAHDGGEARDEEDEAAADGHALLVVRTAERQVSWSSATLCRQPSHSDETHASDLGYMRVPTKGPSCPIRFRIMKAAERFESSSCSDDTSGRMRPMVGKMPAATRKMAK